MAPLFRDRLHDDFGTWPLGYIPYGGGDFGEVRAVAAAVGDGDDGAYYAAWNAAGDRLSAEPTRRSPRATPPVPARCISSASAFYATSFHPLYGAPVDPRLPCGFPQRQVAALNRGLALGPHPVAPVAIQFGAWAAARPI